MWFGEKKENWMKRKKTKQIAKENWAERVMFDGKNTNADVIRRNNKMNKMIAYSNLVLLSATNYLVVVLGFTIMLLHNGVVTGTPLSETTCF